MGDEWAQGKGSAMTFSADRLRINQARFPVSAGGAMTQQRTPHQLRPLAQDQALSALERFSDQATLTHLAGARGFHDNIEWCVPVSQATPISRRSWSTRFARRRVTATSCRPGQAGAGPDWWLHDRDDRRVQHRCGRRHRDLARWHDAADSRR
jgi:hypothetical protein